MRLRELRNDRGFTQERLCEMSGISREHISYLENGTREACMTNVGKLAEALGVTISEMMQGV